MLPLPAADAWDISPPARYPRTPSHRPARRWCVLGLALALLCLALWLLLTYTPLFSAATGLSAKHAAVSVRPRAGPHGTSWLAYTWATLPYTVRFYLAYWPHAGFVLVEAAVILAGLVLGARGKTLVLALLVGLIYLTLLHAHWLAFAIVLLLTLRVAACSLNPR
jgi:hypothetical protein